MSCCCRTTDYYDLSSVTFRYISLYSVSDYYGLSSTLRVRYFGSDYTYLLRTDKADECVGCPKQGVAIVLQVIFLISVAVVFSAIMYFIMRYPAALQRWVATVAILLTHIQVADVTRVACFTCETYMTKRT